MLSSCCPCLVVSRMFAQVPVDVDKMLGSLSALRESNVTVSAAVDVRMWDAVVSSIVGEHVDLTETSIEVMFKEVLNLKASASWRSLPGA